MTTSNHDAPTGPIDRLILRLIFWQRIRVVGQIPRQILKLLGTDIPPQTLPAGRSLKVYHGAKIVVHGDARIGEDVSIQQNVVIGRADAWKRPREDWGGFRIEDHVYIGAGAAILNSGPTLVVGEGAVIGANSVITRSVPAGEIWAGNPARKVGSR